MSEVVQSSANILIVALNGLTLKVGYAGDFAYSEFIDLKLACDMLHTNAFEEVAVIEIERTISKHRVDATIIILNPQNSVCLKKQILETRKCGNVLFMDSCVCEVLGSGKTSGTVFNFDTLTIAQVINMKLVEYKVFGIDDTHGNNKFQAIDKEETSLPNNSGEGFSLKLQEIIARLRVDLEFFSDWELYEFLKLEKENIIKNISTGLWASISLSIPAVDNDKLSNILKNGFKLIDEVIRFRKCCAGKKLGIIVLCGGLFKNRSFQDITKEYILKEYKEFSGDTIGFETNLELDFTGASVFGSNLLSLHLFITPDDYEKYSSEIFKIKSIN